MMKWLFAAACSALFLLSSCDSSGGWRVFDSAAYTVEFPGVPSDTATMEGDLSGVKLFYQPAENGLDSNVYYSVAQYTLADSLTGLADYYERLFRTDVQIFAWGINGILADSVGKPVVAGKVRGFEYRVLLDQNAGIARIRKFALGRRIYTVMVLTDNAHIANQQANRFLNSFRLK